MKTIYCYISVFLLTISSPISFAQTLEIDSLLQQAKIVKSDTSKVNTYNKLSEAFRYNNDYTESVTYGEKARDLAISTKYKRGTADAYNNLGISLDFLGDYCQALSNYTAALEIRKELDYKEGIAACHNNIGIIYNRQSNYPKALENYTEALKIYLELDHDRGKAACYTNIGHIYFDKHKPDYQKSLENYLEALSIYEKIDYKRGVRYAHNNIGAVYGVIDEKEKMFESYEIAVKLSEELDDKQGVLNYHLNIGNIYTKAKEFEKALESYRNSLDLAEEMKSKDGIAESNLQVGKINFELNQYEKAKDRLNNSLGIYLQLGNKRQIKSTYHYLSKVDSALGNSSNSLEFYKLFKLYNDSIFNEENTEKLTRAEMQFEFDKINLSDSIKQEERRKVLQAKLDKQKAYSWSGTGFGFLLIVFSVFIFKNNKKLSFERNKSDELLLNILPQEVSEELKTKGTTTANHYDNVTVLFTDFVGFTSMSEKMDSQELVDELHCCFKAFDEIISRYDIEKIKTIGDSYMAASGLPKPTGDHAQNILNAAIEIRDFMRERKKEVGEKTFDIRIGVHSGSVVAGVVGVKKFAYDIWGDTVNTAARVEQASKTNKINVSACTYKLAKDDFQFEYRGKIEVKYKGELDMYFVEHKEA